MKNVKKLFMCLSYTGLLFSTLSAHAIYAPGVRPPNCLDSDITLSDAIALDCSADTLFDAAEREEAEDQKKAKRHEYAKEKIMATIEALKTDIQDTLHQRFDALIGIDPVADFPFLLTFLNKVSIEDVISNSNKDIRWKEKNETRVDTPRQLLFFNFQGASNSYSCVFKLRISENHVMTYPETLKCYNLSEATAKRAVTTQNLKRYKTL